MKFPIFHGFIAPDSGAAKPLNAMNTAFSLAAALDAQLSVAIGALQISVRTILSSNMVEGLISDENKRSAASATAAREQITELARKSGLIVHTEILKGDLGSIKRRCANRAREGILSWEWRWRRDSNPCKRLCRPVPSRSATPPRVV